MKKKILIARLAAFFMLLQISPAGIAQPAEKKIDSLFGLPGFLNGGVLVAEKGKIIYQNAFGYANYKTQEKISIDAIFQTASLSKPFTATAVLLLADKKQIKLSDPFRKYFPAFPYPGITIRQLLSHTSGLPDADIFDDLIRNDTTLIVQNDMVLDLLITKKTALHFVPGSRFEYCNAGYQLLALLVEKVSKSSFAIFLDQKIFRVCGMHHSRLRRLQGDAGDLKAVKNHVLYPMYAIVPEDVDSIVINPRIRFLQRLKYDNYHFGWTYGDQNVYTTIGDLFRFTNAFFSGKLISHSLVAEALKPLVLNDGKVYWENNLALGGDSSSYGLGWELNTANGRLIAGHAGYNRGILCQYYYDVHKKQLVVMYDNTEGSAFTQKMLNVLSLLNNSAPVAIDLRKSAARQFGYKLMHESKTLALIHFNEMKLDSANYIFTPQGMNNLGYDFLRNGYHEKALDVFQINLLFYPSDFNRYDSYGDALVELGRTQEAIAMYRKAVSLNPAGKDSKAKLKKLLNEK